MGILRNRKGGDRDATVDTVSTPVDQELNDQAQEVMKDNLELMREVVMRIREEPDFAKNIYRDCPRLQHLLDQYPDLRPIFEDPKLVRINFEQVYRDAGGILPEDEEKKKKRSWLIWLVNSPIFKVLKVLLFAKKLFACIAGGGFAFLSGCIVGCCFEDALEEFDGDAEDGDGDVDGMDPGKEALNRAADHMEDPEVQEHMQQLLDNPDGLEDAIEQDSELRALRDSNPLCEELMSDPDTMRILTDPDNLRALGEAPELIEADFIDPEGFQPTDIETGAFDGVDGGYDGYDGGMDQDFDVDVDAEVDADADFDADDGFEDDGMDAEGEADADADAEGDGEGEADGDEEEEEEWWDDAELEEQDGPDNDAAGKGGKGNAKGAKANAKGAKAQSGQAASQSRGGMGGIMASIGVAATDLIAGQIIGSVFGDGLVPGGGGMGGGGDLDGLDDAAGGADDLGDNMDDIGDAADDAGELVNDDIADVAEDTMDETEDAKKEASEGADGKKGAAVGGAAAGGAAVGGGAGVAVSRSANGNADDEAEGDGFAEGFEDEEDEEEDGKPEKKKKFGWIKSGAAALATAAKEHIATNLLGDDFGEELVEWQEEEEEEEDDDKKKKDGEAGEGEKKKKGMFRRKKGE
jgi:hypothetical protein